MLKSLTVKSLLPVIRRISSTTARRAEFAYQLQNVDKFANHKPILKDVSLSFYHGAKIGVLGHNGSGKSTLIKILAGEDTEFTGSCIHHPRLKIGYLPQEPVLNEKKSIKENIEEGCVELLDLLKQYDELSDKFAEEMTDEEMNKLLEEQGELQEKLDVAGAWDIDKEIEDAMKMLRVPRDEDGFSIATLSGGEKRRVALARLILSKPDLLLFDEPTNHLDAASVAWLERYLAEFKGTVLCVTHDRYFLDNVAGWMLEMVNGSAIPFKGNYTEYLVRRAQRLELKEKADKKRDRAIEAELEWIRQPAKARQAKGKARLRKYEEMVAQKGDERVAEGRIFIPPGPRLGQVVISAKGVRKSFEGRILFENLNFSIEPGSVVGIVGANGAGKTTLFRMITGEVEPDEGEFYVGKTVKLAWADQARDQLRPDARVWEEIVGGNAETIRLGNTDVNARQYCAWFNFKGDQQQRLVGTLSGGERNRVHLARAVRENANLLLLDEPTNDLDVDTVRSLEDAIDGFAGCALVISHDRWFLNRVATHIMAFEDAETPGGPRKVTFHEGNYDEYAKTLKYK